MRFDSTTWMFPALQYSSSAYDGQISIKTQTKHWKWPLSWPTTKILRYAHTNLLHKHHDTVHWIHARQTQETCSGINSNQNEICAKSLSNLSLDLSSSNYLSSNCLFYSSFYTADRTQLCHSTSSTVPLLHSSSCTAPAAQLLVHRQQLLHRNCYTASLPPPKQALHSTCSTAPVILHFWKWPMYFLSGFVKTQIWDFQRKHHVFWPSHSKIHRATALFQIQQLLLYTIAAVSSLLYYYRNSRYCTAAAIR